MTKSCFQIAADLLSECDQPKLECAGVANWPWSGNEAECHSGNAFVAWESTCCGQEIASKDADCLELPECEASPREAGLLLVVAIPVVLAGVLLLVRCLCRQVGRELQEDHVEMAATQEKGESFEGAPPAHWGGGLALGPPRQVQSQGQPRPERNLKPRKSERVTFRTQDSIMEFPTASSVPQDSPAKKTEEPTASSSSTAPAAKVTTEESVVSVPKATSERPGSPEATATTPEAAPTAKGGGKGPAKGAKGSAEGSPGATSTTPEAAPTAKGGGKGPAKGAKGSAEGSPEATSTTPEAAPTAKGGGKGPAKGAKGSAEGSPEATSTTPEAAPTAKGGGKGPAKGAKGSTEGSPEATSTTPEAAPAAKGGGKASAKAPAPKAAPTACDPNRGETITGANLEEEVTRWIEAISGDTKGDESFGKWLKDGRILCGVANKIQPGIIPNVNSSKMPFKQMENVTAFIQACRKLGVLEKDVFSTVDLFEAKNLTSVQRCIFNLGSAVRRTAPEFPGPFLGVAQNAKVGDRKRQSQAVTQFTGLRQDIADELRTGHNVRVAGQAP